MSRIELLQEAAFVLGAAQQAFSAPCHLIGSYEQSEHQHIWHKPTWEAHIRAGQEQHTCTVQAEQDHFVIITMTKQ